MDPLDGFGPNAACHLKRTNGFPNVADIVVNSLYDARNDVRSGGKVAAFEELVARMVGLVDRSPGRLSSTPLCSMSGKHR